MLPTHHLQDSQRTIRPQRRRLQLTSLRILRQLAHDEVQAVPGSRPTSSPLRCRSCRCRRELRRLSRHPGTLSSRRRHYRRIRLRPRRGVPRARPLAARPLALYRSPRCAPHRPLSRSRTRGADRAACPARRPAPDPPGVPWRRGTENGRRPRPDGDPTGLSGLGWGGRVDPLDDRC